MSHSIENEKLDHTPIEPHSWLPMEQIPLEPLGDNYVKMVLAESLLFSVALMIGATGAMVFLQLPKLFIIGMLSALSIVLVFGNIFRNLQAKRLAYAITSQELLLAQGIFWHKRTSLPFTRLQHVSLSQGPLEKFFGLKRLKCFSAGSGVAEIDIRGLDEIKAEHLRQHLLVNTGIEARQHQADGQENQDV